MHELTSLVGKKEVQFVLVIPFSISIACYKSGTLVAFTKTAYVSPSDFSRLFSLDEFCTTRLNPA